MDTTGSQNRDLIVSPKRRIVYIDYLKGLTILWVVWYHTVHPSFVEFSFRIPLFFFVSGIFFKPYKFDTFLKKKVNTLIVPFIFFYLIYYIYYILLWLITGRSLLAFDYSSIFSIFEFHRGSEGFVINPPLWFIFALVNLQFLLYFLVKIKTPKVAIALLAGCIYIIDIIYLYDTPSLFMWWRSLRYFVYYSFGYLFGRQLLSVIEGEHGKKLSLLLGMTGLSAFMVCWQFKNLSSSGSIAFELITCVEIFALILFMVYLLKYLSALPLLGFLDFYGKNSYIVLGMHEIILTILLIAYHQLFNCNPGILAGLTMLILTIIILWPTVRILNRVAPHLVGKRDLWK